MSTYHTQIFKSGTTVADPPTHTHGPLLGSFICAPLRIGPCPLRAPSPRPRVLQPLMHAIGICPSARRTHEIAREPAHTPARWHPASRPTHAHARALHRTSPRPMRAPTPTPCAALNPACARSQGAVAAPGRRPSRCPRPRPPWAAGAALLLRGRSSTLPCRREERMMRARWRRGAVPGRGVRRRRRPGDELPLPVVSNPCAATRASHAHDRA